MTQQIIKKFRKLYLFIFLLFFLILDVLYFHSKIYASEQISFSLPFYNEYLNESNILSYSFFDPIENLFEIIDSDYDSQNINKRSGDDYHSFNNLTPDGFCLNVPVLLYHHVQPFDVANQKKQSALSIDPSFFESHIKYLIDNGYIIVSAEELIDALSSKQKIAGKPVVITLDDGYEDWYTYAYPIAKKFGAKLSMMISTGLLDTKDYLTWFQLKEMVDSGLVFAYNHTWSHYYLSEAEERVVEYEIATATRQLEERIGVKPTVFTYPYGSFSYEIILTLREQGFKGAFTTNHSFLQCDSFIYTLNRNHIGNAPLSYYGI